MNFLSVLTLLGVLHASLGRHLSMMDIQDFVDQLGDEILSHEGLKPSSDSLAVGLHNLGDSVNGDIVSLLLIC